LNLLKEKLVKKALSEGFDICRVCSPDSIPEAPDRLDKFLSAGYHGQMKWLEENRARRQSPKALWPETKSIIMLAQTYGSDIDPLELLKNKNSGCISIYARNNDYHEIIKKRLKALGRWLLQEVKELEIKVFVDTAPVMEKPLGQSAGLGWQGKHTNLVSRQIGNWFFLGSIFTSLELPIDQAEVDHCGNCRKCLDICPTRAFPSPYTLDARRCISYLTIEHDGPVDEELRPLIGNRIYGCDDCLAVCPWNKFAKTASESGYISRLELMAPELKKLVTLSDQEFRTLFKKSPIKRIGRNRFVRNVIYAIGNSENLGLISCLKPFLNDNNYMIRDAANWAFERLSKQ